MFWIRDLGNFSKDKQLKITRDINNLDKAEECEHRDLMLHRQRFSTTETTAVDSTKDAEPTTGTPPTHMDATGATGAIGTTTDSNVGTTDRSGMVTTTAATM